MNDIYLWCVTGMSALLALNTLWRLFMEPERLKSEDLSDDDRAFAWRTVIFLIFPLMVFLDLRSTIVSCQWLGGYINNWSYGLLWYDVIPAGLHSSHLMLLVLFAGVVVQLILSACMLFSLLFRPHPFLATVVGYTVAFMVGYNLIGEPLLSLASMAGPRWQLIYSLGSNLDHLILLGIHLSCVAMYMVLMFSQRLRFWFATLSRPTASDELKKALSEWKARPASTRLNCRLGLLYDRAGLRRTAQKQLDRLPDQQSLYYPFLKAVLSYRRRDYKKARQAFLFTSDFPFVDGSLKASLLAASACSAFADGDVIAALHLSDRALEFDDACLVARMVKVDVYLRQGKKEQAGEEILSAMHRGLSLDLESKIPLDIDRAFEAISRLEDKVGRRAYEQSGALHK